ncbi:hypothetical protein N7533_001506 [Penicillium manginii]|uniref:uncharacterized protein n=1 Tax=Penicillium manginii TaxID=203109 RepID=UPI0025466DF4|nr:uncharacterized protein N7533_001506 [Penicillium manginii]KAJ5762825.1 hypothetical protein N7533_001506 [Penicillium manginii]
MDIENAISGGKLKEKVLDADDAQLIAMGKKPELQRVYNTWTLCAYQVMISASWSCLIVLYSTIFDVGGPFGLVWATLIVSIGQTLLMTSLAEYCSIWPTAGGQQYYTQALATGRSRPFLSYLVGWAIMVGEISTGSSCALNSAQIIASFVQIAHPNIEWKSWMTWLLYTGLLIGPVITNLNQRWLPGVNLFGAIWVVGGGVAWAIVFIVMAPKHDAKVIFTEFLNNTGYENTGWNDASTPQPYMSWWIGVTGSLYGGGLFCALVMIGINFFVIVGTNNAGSRIVWSMARDKAFPYSEYLAQVSPRFGIPLRAIGFVVVVDLILGLIVLGSDLAFQSIISGGGLMLQVSYLVPVVIVLVRGRKTLPPRPHFDLGRWGYAINIFSIGATILFPGLYWIFGARFRYIKEQNSVMEDNVVVIDGVAIAALEAMRRNEGAQIVTSKE